MILFCKFILLVTLILLTGCREELIQGLSENEANKLMSDLFKTGISPEKIKDSNGSYKITVPTEALSRSINVLQVRKIGNQDGKRSGSFLSNKYEQQFNIEREQSYEIQRTLETLTGVLEARIHFSIPKEGEFLQSENKEMVTAGVLLTISHDFGIDIESVRDLVAGSSGIKKENVRVILESKNLPKNYVTEKSGFTVSEGEKEILKIFLALLVIGLLLLFRFLIINKKRNGARA